MGGLSYYLLLSVIFPWIFSSKCFHCGVSNQCPMDSSQWVIAGDTHSDIVTLYLKHFHQSHSPTHIKEGCITGYVNYDGY